jgi:hypothetical protein
LFAKNFLNGLLSLHFLNVEQKGVKTAALFAIVSELVELPFSAFQASSSKSFRGQKMAPRLLVDRHFAE